MLPLTPDFLPKPVRPFIAPSYVSRSSVTVASSTFTGLSYGVYVGANDPVDVAVSSSTFVNTCGAR